MRLKPDENLPHRLVRLQNDLGHDADTVFDERLAGRDDDVVWTAAQTNRRFLLPKTSTSQTPGSTSRVHTTDSWLVRLAQPGREALFERVSALFRSENVEAWAGCIVTATPHKVRVRRPSAT